MFGREIADVVTVCVVHRFEMIDVDHRDRKLPSSIISVATMNKSTDPSREARRNADDAVKRCSQIATAPTALAVK